MSRETVLFKNEEKKTRNEVVEILKTIVDKIEQGKIALSNNTGSVELDLPQNLTLEIKVEEETKRKTKRSLEIELEWIVGGDDQGEMVIG